MALAALAAASLTACGGGGAEPSTGGAPAGTSEMAAPAAGPATAEKAVATATTTAVAYTVPTGRLLASNCFGCHGTDGRPNGGFDALAGESAEHIVSELRELAAKPDGGIMRVHALGYTDQQMWELGTYFASQR